MNQSVPAQTKEIVVRKIRRTNSINPLGLVKTLEDLLNFPSVACNLQTTKLDEATSGNMAFVIVASPEGDETAYAIYLQTGDQKSGKSVIAYDPLKAWDPDAELIPHAQ